MKDDDNCEAITVDETKEKIIKVLNAIGIITIWDLQYRHYKESDEDNYIVDYEGRRDHGHFKIPVEWLDMTDEEIRREHSIRKLSDKICECVESINSDISTIRKCEAEKACLELERKEKQP